MSLLGSLSGSTSLSNGAGRGLPDGQQLRQQGKVEQKQFKRGCWFRALHYAALRVKGHLPCRVQMRRRKLRGNALPQGCLVCRKAQARHNGLTALAQ